MEITAKNLYEMSMLDSIEVPGEVLEDWETGTSITSDTYTMPAVECAHLRLCLMANDEDPTNDARVLELHDAIDDGPAAEALVAQVADCIENFRYDARDNVIGVIKGRKVKEGIKVHLKYAPKKSVVMKKLRGRTVKEVADEQSDTVRLMKLVAASMGVTFNSLLTLKYGDYQQCVRAFSFLMGDGPA